jgi:N-succinyl-L-ornithine transcarbamylase
VVQAKAWSGWSGYGRREDEAEERRRHFGVWRLDGEAMALTDDAFFMHCLPVRRNVVVTDEVIDSPRSLTNETGGLRMWTAMALLERFLDGGR